MYSDRHIFPTHAGGSFSLLFCEIPGFICCIVAARSSIVSHFMFITCTATIQSLCFFSRSFCTFITSLEDTLRNTRLLMLVFFNFFSLAFQVLLSFFDARDRIVHSV